MLSVYRRSGVFVTMSRAIGQSIPAPGGLIPGRVDDRPVQDGRTFVDREVGVCSSRLERCPKMTRSKLSIDMEIGTLYVEELRATMRGRFALVGAGVILLAVGCVATVGTQDTWLDGYGMIAYFLVPLAFVPLTAVFLASPRANRFVESVFTAPVERRDWLTAKVLVIVTIAAAYYVALIPMVLVYTHHVGMPLLLQKLLIWAPCLLVASIAMGTLIGVLFIGESIAAPAATGMGVLLAYAGFVPLQELLVAQGNGATRTGHLTLASPAVLLKNAFGFTLAVGSIPATTTRTWISLVAVIIVAFSLAVWTFLRTQGVETWEASRSQRWMIALGIIATIVLPVAMADTNYDKPAPHATNAPSIQRLFSRAGSSSRFDMARWSTDRRGVAARSLTEMSGLRLGQTSLRGGICWCYCRWIPRSTLRTCISS